MEEPIKSLPVNFTKGRTYDLETDRIIAFLQDKSGTIKLNPKEQEMLERINFADNLIRQYGPQRIKVCSMLVHKFQYSRDSALRDYREAQLVYGSMKLADKEYWKIYMLEAAAKGMEAAFAKQDLKSAAMFQANMIKCLGLDKDTPNEDDWKKLEQHNYYLVLKSKDENGALKEINLNDLNGKSNRQRQNIADSVNDAMIINDVNEILNSDHQQSNEEESDPEQAPTS